MKNNTSRPLAVGLTILGMLARLVPHAPNFAPVGGVSLFAGGRLSGWKAYLLPLVLMLVTDPLVGGYSFATPFVYASFLIYVWIGSRLRATQNPLAIGGAAVAGSIQFFVITNFGVWLGSTATYAHTAAGLMACYAAAIPYYRNTVLADLFYSAALYGAYALLSRRVAAQDQTTA
ncbi:MAG: DUF6580 family putative transport protein [Bryobacteraceae bacterium]